MKKGIFTTLNKHVNSAAKNVAKAFKRNHKLSGKTLNVVALLNKSVWHRGHLFLGSMGCLFLLLLAVTVMVALKDVAGIQAAMTDVAFIGSVFAVLGMHFAAKLLFWAVGKIILAQFGPVWEFLSEYLPVIWGIISGFFG